MVNFYNQTNEIKPIILEGPEGAGKSTWAKIIGERHITRRDSNHQYSLEDLKEQINALHISNYGAFDRHYLLSNIVYKNMREGLGVVSEDQYFCFLTDLEKQGIPAKNALRKCRIVVFLPSEEALNRALDKPYKTEEYKELVRKSYSDLLASYESIINVLVTILEAEVVVIEDEENE